MAKCAIDNFILNLQATGKRRAHREHNASTSATTTMKVFGFNVKSHQTVFWSRVTPFQLFVREYALHGQSAACLQTVNNGHVKHDINQVVVLT